MEIDGEVLLNQKRDSLLPKDSMRGTSLMVQ